MMGKFLLWLQEHLKRWTKPAAPASVASLLSDLTRSRSDLIVENALVRQQLIALNRQVQRPQLTNFDRYHMVPLAHFTKFWKQALHIVQPDTLLRRHLMCVVKEYTAYFNQGRPHQGISQRIPSHYDLPKSKSQAGA